MAPRNEVADDREKARSRWRPPARSQMAAEAEVAVLRPGAASSASMSGVHDMRQERPRPAPLRIIGVMHRRQERPAAARSDLSELSSFSAGRSGHRAPPTALYEDVAYVLDGGRSGQPRPDRTLWVMHFFTARSGQIGPFWGYGFLLGQERPGRTFLGLWVSPRTAPAKRGLGGLVGFHGGQERPDTVAEDSMGFSAASTGQARPGRSFRSSRWRLGRTGTPPPRPTDSLRRHDGQGFGRRFSARLLRRKQAYLGTS
ncbi:hypothetical protein LCGC14_1285540 [marine sediment metagenome]|uniref:Uncharacterized protein n=1 Tax=marine sediment metagenome TaxID=412755 RepID=A0A0F9KVM6_9ZZZZ